MRKEGESRSPDWRGFGARQTWNSCFLAFSISSNAFCKYFCFLACLHENWSLNNCTHFSDTAAATEETFFLWFVTTFFISFADFSCFFFFGALQNALFLDPKHFFLHFAFFLFFSLYFRKRAFEALFCASTKIESNLA